MPRKKLNDAQRSKLERIRANNSSSGRQRLIRALTEKLIKKYGASHRVLIKSQVSKVFKKSTAKVTKDDVRFLEQEVAKLVGQKEAQNKKKTANEKRQAGINATSANVKDRQRDESKFNDDGEEEIETLRSSMKEINPWSLIRVHGEVEYEDYQKKKKIEERKAKEKLRKELEAQVARKKAAEKQWLTEDTKYAKYQLDDVKKYEKEEKEKEQKRKLFEENLKKARDRQLADINRRKKESLEKKMADEEEILEQCRKEIELAKKKARQAKEAQWAMLEEVKRGNDRLRELREKQKEEDRLYDQKLMKEYSDREDAKERARRAHFEAIAKRQEQAFNRNLSSVYKGEVDNREAELRRIQAEQDKKNREADERTRREAETRRKNLAEQAEILKRQVALKKERLEKEKEDRLNFARQYMRGDQSQKMNNLKERRKRNLQYRKDLEQQITTTDKNALDVMSKDERLMNKNTITEILNDNHRLPRMGEKLALSPKTYK
eukprot:g945.t1